MELPRAIDGAKDCRDINMWQGLRMRNGALITEDEWCVSCEGAFVIRAFNLILRREAESLTW